MNRNLRNEQGKVRRAALAALLFCAVVLAGGYLILPRLFQFPAELVDRLAFAVRADLFVLVWILIGVRMVSSGRFRSPADIDGSAAGPPSPVIATKVAFLQNTLEQSIMAIGVHLALATLLGGDALSLIISAVVLFAVGRVTFFIGYPKGAGGRAFGMVTTVLPTLVGFVLAIVLMVARL
jgi:hypothetical protein